MNKPVNQKAWFLILPVFLCVAFSAILPLMTVVNYSVQDIISPERRVFVGTEWFAAVMRDEELHAALWRQLSAGAGGTSGIRALDLSGVDRIDSAGLALVSLIAARGEGVELRGVAEGRPVGFAELREAYRLGHGLAFVRD